MAVIFKPPIPEGYPEKKERNLVPSQYAPKKHAIYAEQNRRIQTGSYWMYITQREDRFFEIDGEAPTSLFVNEVTESRSDYGVGRVLWNINTKTFLELWEKLMAQNEKMLRQRADDMWHKQEIALMAYHPYYVNLNGGSVTYMAQYARYFYIEDLLVPKVFINGPNATPEKIQEAIKDANVQALDNAAKLAQRAVQPEKSSRKVRYGPRAKPGATTQLDPGLEVVAHELPKLDPGF